MFLASKNGSSNKKINGIFINKKDEYSFHFNNIHMKQSSKIYQKDLPLYDLTIFWCKNPDHGQGPSRAAKTRSCCQQ